MIELMLRADILVIDRLIDIAELTLLLYTISLAVVSVTVTSNLAVHLLFSY